MKIDDVFMVHISSPGCSLVSDWRVSEAVKGLTAEPPGVLFHHFLEMTTQSRWRIFGDSGRTADSLVSQQQRKHRNPPIIFFLHSEEIITT